MFRIVWIKLWLLNIESKVIYNPCLKCVLFQWIDKSAVRSAKSINVWDSILVSCDLEFDWCPQWRCLTFKWQRTSCCVKAHDSNVRESNSQSRGTEFDSGVELCAGLLFHIGPVLTFVEISWDVKGAKPYWSLLFPVDNISAV